MYFCSHFLLIILLKGVGLPVHHITARRQGVRPHIKAPKSISYLKFIDRESLPSLRETVPVEFSS